MIFLRSLTPNITPKGSFELKTFSIRFLVKNRSNGQNVIKIAQAAFFQRTNGLVLSCAEAHTAGARRSCVPQLILALLVLYLPREKCTPLEQGGGGE